MRWPTDPRSKPSYRAYIRLCTFSHDLVRSSFYYLISPSFLHLLTLLASPLFFLFPYVMSPSFLLFWTPILPLRSSFVSSSHPGLRSRVQTFVEPPSWLSSPPLSLHLLYPPVTCPFCSGNRMPPSFAIPVTMPGPPSLWIIPALPLLSSRESYPTATGLRLAMAYNSFHVTLS